MNRRTLNIRRKRFGFGLFTRLSFSGLILMLGASLPSLADSATLINSKAAASMLPSELQTEGSVPTNPYLSMRGKIIVLRSGDGPVGRRFMEEIDCVADFRKAFGYRPPAPALVAVSADSDDTGSRIFGAVADLAFKG